MEEDDEEDVALDIMMSHQAVFKKEILNQTLTVELRTVIGWEDLDLEFETVHDPKPEIVMQSKIQFARKRVFDYIQTLREKTRQERKQIYA